MRFKEIWFDLDGTLAVPNDAWDTAHDNLRYQVYANYVGTPQVTVELRQEYEDLYAQHKSNSAVFRSFGLSKDYWIDHFEAADLSSYYEPREDVPKVLEALGHRAVIGLFTNNKLTVVNHTLDRLHIPFGTFAKVVTGDEIQERKPHLHGFQVMLEQAGCKPNELIYIGDRYHVDVEPAQKLGAHGGIVWAKDDRADYSFPEFNDLLALNA